MVLGGEVEEVLLRGKGRVRLVFSEVGRRGGGEGWGEEVGGQCWERGAEAEEG